MHLAISVSLHMVICLDQFSFGTWAGGCLQYLLFLNLQLGQCASDYLLWLYIYIYIQCLCEKYWDWCHEQFILVLNKKLYGLPLEVILFEFKALSHPSLQCWKDFYGIPYSSIIMPPLIASTPSKLTPLIIPLSLGKRKMSYRSGNREGVPVWQCPSSPGTGRCSAHPVSLLFRPIL